MSAAATVDLDLIKSLDKQLKKSFAEAEDDKDLRVVAAHKTVATFAALMGKKLWLKNAADAYTDGHEIGAPYKSKYFYQLVEHEIAHNLFKSNFKAKGLFSEQYAEQVRMALESRGTEKVSPKALSALKEAIGFIINVVEDHRIHSLWSLLYPGSYLLLMEAGQAALKPSIATAHDDLISFFLHVAYDMEGLPAGAMDRFRPAMVAALKKVERKGPEATFIVCKWLMTQLVTELIRSMKDEPAPPPAGSAMIQTDIQSHSSAQQGSASNPDSENSNGQAGATTASSEAASNADSNNTGASWKPPSVDASVEDRISAMEKLLTLAGGAKPKQGEERLRRQLEDVQENTRSRATKEAELLVKQAMDTNVNDTALMDKRLDDSEDLMASVVDKLEQALQIQTAMTEEEWIKRNAGAKVVIRNVERNIGTRTPMASEDRRTAARLKQLFAQVHSRKAKMLSESGFEVDIEAFVANKTNNSLGPVFKQETSGRGFKTVVLLDRSGSMQGSKSYQLERGSKILSHALNLPYVQYETWGFSAQDGAVNITRVPKSVDVEGTMPSRGLTPLHIALRTAVNYLGSGDEKKQIIVLTDGEPVFSSAKGNSYNSKNLMQQVAQETARARKQGINVTALAIGNDVTREQMKLMFGSPRHWTQVLQSSRLGEALVTLVTTSFMQYLKNG